VHAFTTSYFGDQPMGELIQGVDGNLYGTTSIGGNQEGTLFKLDLETSIYTSLHIFAYRSKDLKYDYYDGFRPYAGLVQGKNGMFYGTTTGGGGQGYGSVFVWNPVAQLESVIYSFSSTDANDGASPYASLIQGKDGAFYGTTFSGGKFNGKGTIFKLTY
jgi:uncharacterized repeat protein (TIGR03803 family)